MSGNRPVQLPDLPTLESRPSWVNSGSRGRTDRSACAEIRASELKQIADLQPVEKIKPLPGTSRPESLTWCEAVGDVTITARFLAKHHSKRSPIALLGDTRSPRANAMKSRYRRQDPHDIRRGPTGLPYQINPNRSAVFGDRGPTSKMLGLWEGWSHTIRIERWRLHDRLARHFLICPTSRMNRENMRTRTGAIRGAKGARTRTTATHGGSHEHASEPQSVNAVHARIPSACDPLCLTRTGKLFLPLCTVEEARDADLAEGFIQLLDATYRAMRRPIPWDLLRYRARLIDRYGILFRGSHHWRTAVEHVAPSPEAKRTGEGRGGGSSLTSPDGRLADSPAERRGVGCENEYSREDLSEHASEPLSVRAVHAGGPCGSDALLPPTTTGRVLLCRTCLNLRYGDPFRGRGTEYYARAERRRKEEAGTLTVDDLPPEDRRAMETLMEIHREFAAGRAWDEALHKLRDLADLIASTPL